MKKSNRLMVIVLFIFFSLSLTSVLADGCFLYPDSVAYCTDITAAEAQEECSFQDRCETQKVFKDNILCSSLNECQKIVCKDSCREEFIGRCQTGAVGENDCKTGCCQFDYSIGLVSLDKFCNYTLSKRNCEIEAQNKEAEGYYFNTQLNAKSCNLWCNEGKNISNQLELLTSNQPKKETKLPSFLIILGYIFLLILVLWGIYIFLRKIVQKYLPDFTWSQIEEKSTEVWKKFYPFSSNQKVQENIENIKKNHQDKIRKHQREELLGTPVVKEDSFHKLKKLTLSRKKELTTLNLDEIFKSLPPPSSEKVKSSLPPANSSLSKKEDLFKKLKNLANK